MKALRTFRGALPLCTARVASTLAGLFLVSVSVSAAAAAEVPVASGSTAPGDHARVETIPPVARLADDGVKVNADGDPFYATFSICAIDRAKGQSGVAVTTRVPFVGRAVPWVRAGVGAVATQSWTVVEYGVRGLDLLQQGMPPETAMEHLLADDSGRELRQVGIIDMQGRTASHTGEKNGAWAGGRQGKNYTVQANIMVGPQVVDAVADHFESTEATDMPLAERLILALEAGQAEGGDKRWGLFQSAALRVADPNEPGRGGDHLIASIDVGEHEAPVQELKRIYYKTARRLGWRGFSEIRGPDVVELKRMLHALGYWRSDVDEVPEQPDFEFDRERQRSDPEGFQKALAEYRSKAAAYSDSWEVFDETVVEAVDAFRGDQQIEYEGNPAGLVDERLIKALRAEYAQHMGW